MKKRGLTLYYAVCAFVICWLSLIPGQLADPDLWGRLSVAALWFQNGHFPYRDVFSFTAFHHRWIDHEWLSGVLFYAALWQGGEIALHCLKYGLILALFYLMFSHCRKTVPHRNNLPVLLFILTAVLFPLYGDAFLPTVRAQIFSFLYFGGFLWVLEQVRQSAAHEKQFDTGESGRPPKARFLLSLIPLGVIWANTHGGFILGLILLALYGLGALLGYRSLKAATPYWLTALGLFFSIAISNPYGFDYWPFILHALTMPRPFISEWRPLSLFSAELPELKLLMLSIWGLLLAVVFRKRSTSLTQEQKSGLITTALVLLFLMILSFKGVRFKAFFTLGVFFYLPVLVAIWDAAKERADSVAPKKSTWLLVLPGIVAGTALAFILLVYPPHFYARTIVQAGDYAKVKGLVPFPVGMMKILQASPYHGNLINPFSWGEFLSWTLYPRFKVAWDGRYEEVYQNPEVNFFTEFYALPHPYNPGRILTMADRSAGDFILIEVISPNQSIIARDPEWHLLATDGFYFLYGRISTLKKLPPFIPMRTMLTPATYTIGDFFAPADMHRFQTP